MLQVKVVVFGVVITWMCLDLSDSSWLQSSCGSNWALGGNFSRA